MLSAEVFFTGAEERMGLRVDSDQGYVTRVEPGLTAAKSGVRVGCVVAKIDGEDVPRDRAAHRLQEAMRKRQPFRVAFCESEGALAQSHRPGNYSSACVSMCVIRADAYAYLCRCPYDEV